METSTWVIIYAVIGLSGSTYTGETKIPPGLETLWYPNKYGVATLCDNIEEQNEPENSIRQPISYKSNPGWQAVSFEPQDQETPQYQDYEEEIQPPRIRKRITMSPYISFGAFNNLPQFFEQLRESIENKEQQRAELMAAAAADNNYRPPSTAAVLNAFRNQGYRRTRSYPPALLQG